MILRTLIPLMDPIAPFGDSVDKIAVMFFGIENAIKKSWIALDSENKIKSPYNTIWIILLGDQLHIIIKTDKGSN